MAPKRSQLYMCSQAGGCDLMVEVVEACAETDCDLLCCGKQMEAMPEKGAAEEGKEKHVPVVEKIDGGYKVTVGSVPHPMEEKHFIQWIELLTPTRSLRAFLNPGQAPEATFLTDETDVTAREHCNLHGVWKA